MRAFIEVFETAQPACVNAVLYSFKCIKFLDYNHNPVNNIFPAYLTLYISKPREVKWLDQGSMVGEEGGTKSLGPDSFYTSQGNNS